MTDGSYHPGFSMIRLVAPMAEAKPASSGSVMYVGSHRIAWEPAST
jgi:hypothetical protein